MNASARVTMKDAAKCDKRCEWQSPANQENAERILHLEIISEGMSVSGRLQFRVIEIFKGSYHCDNTPCFGYVVVRQRR